MPPKCSDMTSEREANIVACSPVWWSWCFALSMIQEICRPPRFIRSFRAISALVQWSLRCTINIPPWPLLDGFNWIHVVLLESIYELSPTWKTRGRSLSIRFQINSHSFSLPASQQLSMLLVSIHQPVLHSVSVCSFNKDTLPNCGWLDYCSCADPKIVPTQWGRIWGW